MYYSGTSPPRPPILFFRSISFIFTTSLLFLCTLLSSLEIEEKGLAEREILSFFAGGSSQGKEGQGKGVFALRIPYD